MSAAPLASAPVIATGRWPAARLAGSLLADLGATVDFGGLDTGALRMGSVLVGAPETSTDQDWADSGIAGLTGRVGGPRLTPAGTPASFARASSLALELLSTAFGNGVRIDGAQTLGQRARLLHLTGGGTASAGGAARLLAARDGWFALNLPRPDDVDLVPALVEEDVDAATDPWAPIQSWAADRSVDEVEQRAVLLGLAVGVLPSRPVAPQPWRITRLADATGEHHGRLVVNLGSLWAAPLAAQLLRQARFEVVDVESPPRPDGARAGTPDFYRALHQGHSLVQVDLQTPSGRAELRKLLGRAAVIITASRPRALTGLGATPAVAPRVRDQVWLRITGHGADGERIAFGDDAAVAGGLVARDGTGPVFAGDAIADPLTGLTAGLAAMACLFAGGSWDVALSMRDIAAACVRAVGSPTR